MDNKITISRLLDAKQASHKIAAVSCYDYTTAGLVASAGVEIILVGDSAAQVMLGHDSTLPATMDFMISITAAVARAAPNVFLVGDMPFLSYQTCISDAVKNAGRFFTEASVQMVKIEATSAYLNVIKAVSDTGMPVMAHIGMQPQYGKLKAEGATAESAVDLISLAKQMIDAGASALLLEGVAREVAKIITQTTAVPVISCGSGADCDGQILVISDILGLSEGKRPKFCKRFGRLGSAAVEALKAYVEEVKSLKYPDDDHCYHVRKSQREQFEKMMKNMPS